MEHNSHKNHSPYKLLMLMAILSFIAMYVLMYSMVNTISNVLPNLNQFYMAGLMTMAMVIIELLVMKHMYKNKRLNALLMLSSLILLIGFFQFTQKQIGVSDRQFLRSMIPHHAGAILMSEQANVKDPEIRQLMDSIIKSQQSEINWMKRKLEELKK